MKIEGRTLALLDVENLMGSTRFSVAEMEALRVEVRRAAKLPADAHVVVGASCDIALLHAGLGWPGARPVWLRGHDGADLALTDVAYDEDIPDRFDQVVIGSGDGMFAIVARWLRAAGVKVVVVSRHGSLSRALAASAPVTLLSPAIRSAA